MNLENEINKITQQKDIDELLKKLNEWREREPIQNILVIFEQDNKLYSSFTEMDTYKAIGMMECVIVSMKKDILDNE